jgi:hypothetical protein
MERKMIHLRCAEEIDRKGSRTDKLSDRTVRALTVERHIADGVKTIMIRKLSMLILAAALLAGCSPFESYPRQQTTTTTTTTYPAGTQLQSDGMCR